MGIYYLPPNCVFAENFTNPGTVAANGGVITGTGVANGRFLPTAATDMISYDSCSRYLFRLNILTIASVVRTTDFTGSFRSLLWCGNSVTAAVYQVGLARTSNRPFWYDGSVVYTPTGTFTSSNESSLIFSCDGTNVVFYVDGLSIGSVVCATGATTDANHLFRIGNTSGAGAQPFSNPIQTVQIYNKAFTAPDALDWHRMAMENY
jgi:hypothetical protein